MDPAVPRVWLVDDDATIRWVMERALRNGGMLPRTFEAAEPALEALRCESPDVLLTDLWMRGQSGLDLLRRIRSTRRSLPVIIMTAKPDLDAAVDAYEGGAFDYLAKPFDIDRAVQLARHAAQSRTPARAGSALPLQLPEELRQSPALHALRQTISRLACSEAPVLITGEAGCGKELVARAIHDNSSRALRPFVNVNVSAIPPEQLEAEIFGYALISSAAGSVQRGRIEHARGGTLFLDEVGGLTPRVQMQLLRTLERHERGRSGLSNAADTRVIAATRTNLRASVEHGSFSADLYQRLAVFRIEVPPLRARSADIPGLLDHYLRLAAAELGVTPKAFSAEARAALLAHGWPGNLRELHNLCRRMTAMIPGGEVQVTDLPLELRGSARYAPADLDWPRALASWADRQAKAGRKGLAEDAQRRFDQVLIRTALAHTGGVRHQAARLLGCGRNTLSRRMRQLGIADRDGPASG